MYSTAHLVFPTFHRVPGMLCHSSPLLLCQQFLLFLIAPLEFLHALVVVVDGRSERSFGPVLSDDEGIEMLFQKDRRDASRGVCIP